MVRPLVLVFRRTLVVKVPRFAQVLTHRRKLTMLTLLALQKLVNVTPFFLAFIQLVTRFILRVVEKVLRACVVRFMRVDFVVDLRPETRLKVVDLRFI
ncbi:MAG: hypothetical protein ACKVX7_06500 [Planctomycetota bacterium]